MTIDLEITAVAHGGDGLGRINGLACFTPFALPGDTVRVHVTRRKANLCWGRLEEVLQPSPDRIEFIGGESASPLAYIWGCFGYPAQAQWKQRIVRESLRRIGGMDLEVGWKEDADCRLGYRTRAEFHGDGQMLGYYAMSTNRVLPMTRCPLCHDAVNDAFQRLQPLGLRGSVMITAHPFSGETLVWASDRDADRVRPLFAKANSPSDRTARARFLMDGVPVINGTFSQSSLVLNRLLVQTVHAMVGTPRALLDLYCGNGNLSLGLADDVRVEGYDHTPEAVNAADALGRGRYHRGGEAEMIEAVARNEFDTILLDPPRSGAWALMPGLAACRAERIVYVSCDPATLARDLKVLAGGGWRVRGVTALDLFPYTPHVETVCWLER